MLHGNLQGVGIDVHPPVGVAVEDGIAFAEALLEGQRALQTARGERQDVEAAVEQPVEQQIQVRPPDPRRRVADQGPLLQGAQSGLEGHGVVQATEVQPRGLERHPRADAEVAGGVGQAGGAAAEAGEIGAAAHTQCPAPRLFHLEDHVLVWLAAVRVLHRHVHLLENAQLVQPLLGLQHIDLAERFPRLHLDLLFDDVAARVVQPADQHLVHVPPRAFDNRVDQIDPVGLTFRGLHGGGQVGLGKAAVHVISEDRLPVLGHLEGTVRLAVAAGHQAAQLAGRDLLVPFDGQAPHQRLRALLHMKDDGDVPALAPILVQRIEGDLHLLEPVGNVQVANRLLVPFQEVAAEPSGIEQGGLAGEHALAQGLAAEIPVALNLNRGHLVLGTGIDVILDQDLLAALVGVEVGDDLGLETALALEMIAQVVGALADQVGIDGALLVHGDQVSAPAGGDFRAGHPDFDQRPGIGLQGQCHAVLVGEVMPLGNAHLRLQVLLLLVVGLHAGHRALQPSRGHLLAGLELGQLQDPFRREQRRAGHPRFADAGAFAGRHQEVDVHLPRVRVGFPLNLDARLVQPVVIQQATDGIDGPVFFILCPDGAEVHSGDALQLPVPGGLGHAFNEDAADKEVLLVQEGQPDAVAHPLGIHQELGKPQRPIQPFDALPDLVGPVRLTQLDGKQFQQALLVFGTQVGNAEITDRQALVLAVGCRERKAEGEKEAKPTMPHS